MEKARNRFANLQDELRRVHPSDERKYKVDFFLKKNIFDIKKKLNTSLKVICASFFTPNLYITLSTSATFFFIFFKKIDKKHR